MHEYEDAHLSSIRVAEPCTSKNSLLFMTHSKEWWETKIRNNNNTWST